MSDPKPTCFIIMPISTPGIYYERYKEDKKHFQHVLECLFIPAIEEAGFTAIPPIAEGAEHIHAKIIETLSECDLVLCDMSILNANVFFELGVRTALDKPVALVADSDTVNVPPHIPFDVRNINFHEYNPSLAAYDTKVEVPKLVTHITSCAKTSDGRNTLWKYYGISQKGVLNIEDATIPNKLDLLLSENSKLRADFMDLENKVDSAVLIPASLKRAEEELSSISTNHKVNRQKTGTTKHLTKRDLEVLRQSIKNCISKMPEPITTKRVIDHLEEIYPKLVSYMPEITIKEEVNKLLFDLPPDLQGIRD